MNCEGEVEARPGIVYPALVETKGPNPIEFENGYVAYEDLPEDKKRNIIRKEEGNWMMRMISMTTMTTTTMMIRMKRMSSMMKMREMTNRRRIAALDFDSLKLKVSWGIILIKLD